MNALSGIARISSRIAEITNSFPIARPAPAGVFSEHLERAAESQAPTETPTAEPVTAAPVAEYVTLGGTAVVVAAAPSSGLASADSVPELSSWIEGLPAQGRQFAESIDAVARETGLDPRLLAGLVWAESSFIPDAVSSAGAIGLAQLMPGTAAGLQVDPWDPEANLRGGARYLVEQIERFDSLELGLAAYNAGPGRVIEHDGAPSYTHGYIDRVLGYYEQLGGTR